MKLTKLEKKFFKVRRDYPNHLEFAGRIILHGTNRSDNLRETTSICGIEYWVISLSAYQQLKEALNEQV